MKIKQIINELKELTIGEHINIWLKIFCVVISVLLFVWGHWGMGIVLSIFVIWDIIHVIQDYRAEKRKEMMTK